MAIRSGIVCGIILTGLVATGLADATNESATPAAVDASRAVAAVVGPLEARPDGLRGAASGLARGLARSDAGPGSWTRRRFDALELVYPVEGRAAKRRGPLA
jgi:hypothetical protein